AGAPIFTERVQGAKGGTIRTVSPFDGLIKHVTFLHLDDYPFVVSIGQSEDEILAAWRTRAGTEGIIVFSAVAGLIILGSILVVQLRERERTQEALRSERALLQEAIDALPDGFALYDRGSRLLMSNRRYREIRKNNPLAYEEGVTIEVAIRNAIA